MHADLQERLECYRECEIPTGMKSRDNLLLNWILEAKYSTLHEVITNDGVYRSLKLWTRCDGAHHISMWGPVKNSRPDEELENSRPKEEFMVLNAKVGQDYTPMLLTQTEAFILTSAKIRKLLFVKESLTSLRVIPRFNTPADESCNALAINVTESQLEYVLQNKSVHYTTEVCHV